mmetsp:Transcript_55097/g.172758  ORF Transcript_55097/g.172758 Transcript_55097/m.172758 type:complete len:444 (-) Transcript_55097:45-1376(-)
MHHALPLGDQVEVVRECLSVAHQGVVRARKPRILHATRAVDELSGLHAHVDARGEDISVRQTHLGAPHHKPLAGNPTPMMAGAPILPEHVETALHACDGLRVLTHGELLEVVVGLEKDLTEARAAQPLRLEALPLPAGVSVARPAHGAVVWIQGEEGFASLAPPHLDGDRQVLQIHAGGWVARMDELDRTGAPLQRHAAHALERREAQRQARQGPAAGSTALQCPTDAILLAVRLLLGSVLPCVRLLLLLGSGQDQLGFALPVDQDHLIAMLDLLAVVDREAAHWAQEYFFSIGVVHHLTALVERDPIQRGLGLGRLAAAVAQNGSVCSGWREKVALCLPSRQRSWLQHPAHVLGPRASGAATGRAALDRLWKAPARGCKERQLLQAGRVPGAPPPGGVGAGVGRGPRRLAGKARDGDAAPGAAHLLQVTEPVIDATNLLSSS